MGRVGRLPAQASLGARNSVPHGKAAPRTVRHTSGRPPRLKGRGSTATLRSSPVAFLDGPKTARLGLCKPAEARAASQLSPDLEPPARECRNRRPRARLPPCAGLPGRPRHAAGVAATRLAGDAPRAPAAPLPKTPARQPAQVIDDLVAATRRRPCRLGRRAVLRLGDRRGAAVGARGRLADLDLGRERDDRRERPGRRRSSRRWPAPGSSRRSTCRPRHRSPSPPAARWRM